ncbi:MAG: hypothetical protein DDT35_00475 [Firmicutes bacterium]|nr:hypothetical protein [Bacillota bacterium]
MAVKLLSPEEYLGFPVGADRCLANWEQIEEYARLAAANSPRISANTLGMTTAGRPFIALTITSPANHERLAEIRDIQKRLANPRGQSAEELTRLIEAGKTVVLVTCGIHATEVGASQMSMQLIYELATSDTPETQEILCNTVLLLVPSLNPDGLDMVVSWYKKTLGTPYEGTAPPFLYHKYAGHDNNRDWFMFTQQETRLAVEKLHNFWCPHIVLDQHQQNSDGPRLVLPPFIDPYDPNVDPIIRQGVAWLGQAIAMELTAQGKTGVMTNAIYDAWSPSRAYQHYHGGVRILSEAASVRIATPITIDSKDLQAGRGQDPRIASWNQPEPWPGGQWRLQDIVEYDKICAWACLMHAAKFRRQWLRNFSLVSRRALLVKEGVYAYLIPREQRDVLVMVELLDILMFAGVEVYEAQDVFTADGMDYVSGTFVILLHQPYGAFAKTMLEKQLYPELRLYPGGPPKRPYDTTAHSLPIQMGVTAVEVRAPLMAELRELTKTPSFSRPNLSTTDGSWLYIRPEANRSFTAFLKFCEAGFDVYRLHRERDGASLPPGTFLLKACATACALVMDLSEKYGLKVGVIDDLDQAAMGRVKAPRVGIYQSSVPNPDEGWLRFVLEEHEFPYTSLGDRDIRRGNLSVRYDALILPSAELKVMQEGHPPGTYPSAYTGGLGASGASALRAFVDEGGTLLAIDKASEWAIRELSLPVSNVVAACPETEFFVPGSFLRVVMDPNHPLGYGMPRETAVVFSQSPAFSADGHGRVVGKYPMVNPLLSGWILGAERLYGRGALVLCGYGAGKVVLVGFRPYFRAQARGTYKVLFNALLYATS